MALLLTGANRPMNVGNNRRALYAPFAQNAPATPVNGTSGRLTQIIAETMGWWDASSPQGLVGPGGSSIETWSAPANMLADLTGNGRDLLPFSNPSSTTLPRGSPHLSGLLGGAGFPVAAKELLQPALDATSGWQRPSSVSYTNADWTWYMVWSRPNWRQATGFDAAPVTLLTIGSRPILQLDSSGGSGRLILFPGTNQLVVSSSMSRRHTHSIVIQYSARSGLALWLDDVQVAQSVQVPSEALTGQVLLLHDGNPFGAAQCWFHEAAEWGRALSNHDITTLLSYASRWTRGNRKGLYFIFNGQSNAVNYSINDGAAALLARGVAWYLGALSYNVLATIGGGTNYTMASGHGLYTVRNSGYPYPGSFVADPQDGSNPSDWQMGHDGLAVQQAIAGLHAEDLSDIWTIVWPWNETDSLRQYGESSTFEAAALRFLSFVRSMLGDTTNNIPLIWWNAIPYGSTEGMAMHRSVVQNLVASGSHNVIVGNPQTSDSNPRNSLWDPLTGIAVAGDTAHRDSIDNLRFAKLAAPVVARALLTSGHVDSLGTIPACIPRRGGPTIAHVYRQTDTKLVITLIHDSGNDIKVPLQAAAGAGFAVMDGGAPENAGAVVQATFCQRIDATHLLVVLDQPLRNASPACQLFYPYGSAQIGRGNAVTDNFSAMSMTAGWNISADLGPDWSLDFPLSATFSGIPLSDVPA